MVDGFKRVGRYMKRGHSYLHRIVWQAQFGEIPKGFDIHHKDGDPLNNKLENLECIPHGKHLSTHMKENKKLHDWHKTEKGRKCLGEHAKKVWRNRKVHTLTCLHCKKDFQAKQVDRAKYCDNKCEQAARRVRGDDNIERNCLICLKPFIIGKHQKTKTCGYSCGSKYRTRFAKGTRKHRKSFI